METGISIREREFQFGNVNFPNLHGATKAGLYFVQFVNWSGPFRVMGDDGVQRLWIDGAGTSWEDRTDPHR
jgi:hypothetical protein